MKLIANNYTTGETIKIIREWTELTQKEFAKSIGYKTRDAITKIEGNENQITFAKLMEIAKKHNLVITIEKK